MLCRILSVLASCLVIVCAAPIGHAQDYPNKPIRILVGYVPGPGPDLAARTIAPKLSELLGQPVVVENKPGAAGTVATAYVAAAPADGYTLLMAEAAQLVIAPYVIKGLAYSPTKDLTPISLVTQGSGFVLVANPKKGNIRTLQDLIREAKANPGKLTYGTAGIGSTHQLIMESFKEAAGFDILHVPYKGGGQSLPAFLAGEHDIWTGSLQSIWPHVKAGSATLLAVSAGKRLGVIGDVPSLSEVVPGFDMESHTGLLGPAGLPPAVVNKLHAAVVTTLQDPAIRTALSAENTRTVRSSSGAEYGNVIQTDLAKYERGAQLAKITPQ